ncbi:hypothetical protein HY500_00585 [Candidatus Woesearchaeota archaeon]|nr:hypothetical protein [Candidatus Woesearchaeota archaeon]
MSEAINEWMIPIGGLDHDSFRIDVVVGSPLSDRYLVFGGGEALDRIGVGGDFLVVGNNRVYGKDTLLVSHVPPLDEATALQLLGVPLSRFVSVPFGDLSHVIIYPPG